MMIPLRDYARKAGVSLKKAERWFKAGKLGGYVSEDRVKMVAEETPLPEAPMMYLVEQHLVTKADPRWHMLDHACFRSKNLYNAANYIVRQEFIHHHRYIRYEELANQMKANPDFCALPRKVSQQVLKQVDHDWQSFFAALKAWKVNPGQFLGEPKRPKYKHKTEGRNQLVYTEQAVSKRDLKKKGVLQPSQLGIEIETQQRDIVQVRISPRKTHYLIEIVYRVPLPKNEQLNPEWFASMDIGLNNLAAVTSNKPGFRPFLVNGRPLKRINHYYNKHRSELQSVLAKAWDEGTKQQLDRLTHRRNCKIKHELHVASRRIIDHLVSQGIGLLIIGQNKNWKQEINLGKRSNQNFVSIPHSEFVELLTYKAKLAGMKVILTEESYTSKCSFLDLEPLCKHDQYLGKRVKRGLFVSSTGRKINADLNGSYNIGRKAAPDAWTTEGVERAVVHASTLHYIA